MAVIVMVTHQPAIKKTVMFAHTKNKDNNESNQQSR